MRAVLLQAPDSLLEERRRLGLDQRDEVWEGVLHVVPPPSPTHQLISRRLVNILTPLAEQRGLEILFETGLYDPAAGDREYRVPDIMAVAAALVSRPRIEGGVELVIEILSPDDESRDKLGFYATRGVPEIWLVEPRTRAAEVYVLRGGAYHAVAADDHGTVRAPALGIDLIVVDGPKLRLRWASGSAEV